jgi:ribose transport system permease protein
MSARAMEDAPVTEPQLPDAAPDATRVQRLKRFARFQNVGVIYVWIVIIVVFSIWAGGDFLSWATAKSILNQNAVSGIVALSIIAPLSARTFDLSIGNIVALTGVICAYFLVDKGSSMAVAIAIALVAGLGLGAINAFAIVTLGLDSFIATLATGALMAAATGIMTSNGQAIVGSQLSGGFADISTVSVGGITLPVFYMLVVAVVVWILLEYTVTGRRLQAVGFNEKAARLGGIHVGRLRTGSLLASGLVGGVAGVTLASQLASGTPDVGPTYLLDSFTAAFLGATQFRGGRFNAWGTVVAVLTLGTGRTGLVIVGAQPWVSDMFTGVVLIAALALANVERAARIGEWARGRRRARASASSISAR